MKQASLLLRAFLSLLGTYGTYRAARILITSFVAVTNTILIIDHHFSPTMRAHIEHQLLATPLPSLAHYRHILEQLQRAVPSIARSSVRLGQNHTATVCIMAQMPHLVVNTAYCVTADGGAFERTQLHQACSATLPMMTVQGYHPDNTELNKALWAWIHHVPPTIVATHTVVWKTETAVYLHPTNTEGYTISCTSTTNLTEQLLATCAELIHQQRLKKTEQCTIDLRFAHQIVLRKEPKLRCLKEQQAIACASGSG